MFEPFLNYSDYILYSYEHNKYNFDKISEDFSYLNKDEIKVEQQILCQISQKIDQLQNLPNKSHKSTRNQFKMIKLKEPFPCLSLLTKSDMTVYLDLQQRFKSQNLDNKALNRFRDLHSKIINEQNDYQKYLESVAIKHPEPYQYLCNSGQVFLQDLFQFNLKRVLKMPKFFTFCETISLMTNYSPTLTTFFPLQGLYLTGFISKVVKPNLKDKCSLNKKYEALKRKFDYLLPDATNLEFCEIEQDPVILELCKCCDADIAICESSLQCLFDNHAPNWSKAWEIVVKVTEIGVSKKKCILINKNFLQKNLSIAEKQYLYSKYALKASLIKKTKTSIDSISLNNELCGNDIENAAMKNTNELKTLQIEKRSMKIEKDYCMNSNNISTYMTSDDINHNNNYSSDDNDSDVSGNLIIDSEIKFSNIDLSCNKELDSTENDMSNNNVASPATQKDENICEKSFQATDTFQENELKNLINEDKKFKLDAATTKLTELCNLKSDILVEETSQIRRSSRIIERTSQHKFDCSNNLNDSVLDSSSELRNSNKLSKRKRKLSNTSSNIPSGVALISDDNDDISLIDDISTNVHDHYEPTMKIKEFSTNSIDMHISLNDPSKTMNYTMENKSKINENNAEQKASDLIIDKIYNNDKLNISEQHQVDNNYNREIIRTNNGNDEIIKNIDLDILDKTNFNLIKRNLDIVNYELNNKLIDINYDKNQLFEFKCINNESNLNRDHLNINETVDSKLFINNMNEANCLSERNEFDASKNDFINIQTINSNLNFEINRVKNNRSNNDEMPILDSSANPLDEILSKQSLLLTNWQNKPTAHDISLNASFTGKNVGKPEIKCADFKNDRGATSKCYDINKNELIHLCVYKNSNISYNLWQLGRFKMIVQQKYNGYQNFHDGTAKFIELYSKLEYQLDHGFEILTLSDLAHHWLKLKLKPDAKIMRVRINALTGEIVETEDVVMDDLVNFNYMTCLKQMETIMNHLSKLDTGVYLLSHQPGNAHVQIKRQTQNPQGTYDLHLAHEQAAKNVVNNNETSIHWLPIDTNIRTEYHLSNDLIPCLFPLKDETKRYEKSTKNKSNRKR